MKVRIFNGSISIDPSRRTQYYRENEATGYSHVEMDRWLAENPNIDIKCVGQSQDYTPPGPMTTGAIRFVTTVWYEEKPKRRSKS